MVIGWGFRSVQFYPVDTDYSDMDPPKTVIKSKMSNQGISNNASDNRIAELVRNIAKFVHYKLILHHFIIKFSWDRKGNFLYLLFFTTTLRERGIARKNIIIEYKVNLCFPV